jgi:hypothetical protein
MRKKRRNGRVTTDTSVEDEIVHLDLKGLSARWQSVLQRPAPNHLPRHLLFAIIAYRIQIDCFGDLDHEMRQAERPYAWNNLGSGVGSTVAAGDGDVRWVCLEWPDL